MTMFGVLTAFLTILSATAQDTLSQTFAKYERGAFPYTAQMVGSDWPHVKGPLKMLAPDGSCKINNGALYGYFPKGKILGYNSGFTWYSELDHPMEEATMEYDLFFEQGFDFTKGGKLPGLCGLDCPVGCSAVTKQRGWSTRLMWRKGGGMVTYAYYPDKPKAVRCGEDWRWSKKVVPGKWHNVKIYTKINAPGVADGISKAYLDGELVLQKNGIMFRHNSATSYAITRAYITTYVGGSSVSMFAPSRDQYIKFDNFKVYSGTPRTPNASLYPPVSASGLTAVLKVYKKFKGGFCSSVVVTSTNQNCDRWSLNIQSPGHLTVWGIDFVRTHLYNSNSPIRRGDSRFVGLCTEADQTDVKMHAFCS